MKSAIKSFLRNILFQGANPRTFPAIRISDNQINEQLFLTANGIIIEISKGHCIVCHAPFCLMVWLTPDQWGQLRSANFELTVKTEKRICARAYARFNRKIEIENNLAVILTIDKARCFQLNFLRQYFISRYFRNKNSPMQDKIYGAMYSYPRKVIAVSFMDSEGYNIFPMDFQCRIREFNIYILGLRTTNITLRKILKSKKIVIGDTDGASLEVIYFLGSHHSSAPPPLEGLPFKVSNSDLFKFPVPDFSSSYVEVELFENYELGTHMLLLGKVVNTREVRKGDSYLAHIHFFQSTYNAYKREN